MTRDGIRIGGLAAAALLLILAACGDDAASEGPAEAGAADSATPVVRVAVFNIWQLSSDKLREVDADGVGQAPQLRAAATVIQRVRPDILVINEIDHDYRVMDTGLDFTARLFARNYLASGQEPIEYAHSWAAPNNTGILSGLDLNMDGVTATGADIGTRAHGDDSYGYGEYPGQYSMAVLSRYPLDPSRARTFRELLWKDLPGNHLPDGFYGEQAVAALRLSSKSHQDLPVRVGDRELHLLMSHPTPPVFDGEEDRNGRRNFDELRLWKLYLDGEATLRDDRGRSGGLEEGVPFVLLGDLNARPDDAESNYDGMPAVAQLLRHPRVVDTAPWAVSPGAPDDTPQATTSFGGRGARIDYVLPSVELEVLDGGVYWPDPEADPEGNAIAETASDHRLVWMDLTWR